MIRLLFRLFLAASVPGMKRNGPKDLMSVTNLGLRAVVTPATTTDLTAPTRNSLLKCADSMRDTIVPEADAFIGLGLPSTLADTLVSLVTDWQERGITVLETNSVDVNNELANIERTQLEDDFHNVIRIKDDSCVADCITRITTAKDEGDMLALSYLKYLHRTCRKIDHSLQGKSSKSWLRSSAAAGDTSAQYLLALICVAEWDEEERDWKEAFRHFKAAVDQGHAHAQFHTARCYFSGNGTAQSDESAVYYYQLAAAQSHADAQYRLAQCHEQGWGIPLNLTDSDPYPTMDTLYEQSVPYYRIAADNGQADAQYFLAKYHDDTYGNRNETEHMRYLYQAASQGHLGTLNDLASKYSSWSEDAEEAKLALEYNKAAADLGDSYAQSATGSAYLHGYGTEVNYEEALRYLHMGASQGETDAMEELGEMYQEGKGVKANARAAAHWHKIPAGRYANMSPSYDQLRRLELEGKIPE